MESSMFLITLVAFIGILLMNFSNELAHKKVTKNMKEVTDNLHKKITDLENEINELKK